MTRVLQRILFAALGLGLTELAAQVAPANPPAARRPIRVAFVGDDITQGTRIFPPASGGRGAVPIPGVTSDQLAVIAAMTDSAAAKAQAATDARTALIAASLSAPATADNLQARADILRAAELDLALTRAEGFARLQASAYKLGPEQAPVFVQQARGPAPAVRGRGAPAMTAAIVPPPPVTPPTDYPSQVGRLLGSRWDVRNFGVSGTTVLKRGDWPYSGQAAFDAALSFNPDVVVLMFGTSDSKPQNWRYGSEFVADYKDLIARFAALPLPPEIYVAKPTPAFESAYGVDGKVIAEQILVRIDQVATEAKAAGAKLEVIDMHTRFTGLRELVPDGVHPNAAGAQNLALAVIAEFSDRYASFAGRTVRAPVGADFEGGFVPLFNGSDLTGWEFNGTMQSVPAEKFDGKTETTDGRYSVKDGILTVNERVPRMMQRLHTSRQIAGDFVLRLDFRPGPGGDSGVFIRDVQLQVRDFSTMGPYYDITGYKPNDWNELEITIKGQTVYGTCNGQVLEASMTVAALQGTIALEADLGVMEYRRIRIREAPTR